MKTLCFSLGLLLLVVCCCNAMPTAVKFNTEPVNCCFNFFNKKIPKHRVVTVAKTHSSCLNQAFIVKTIKGRQICYKETFEWDLFHSTEGSGQQH